MRAYWKYFYFPQICNSLHLAVYSAAIFGCIQYKYSSDCRNEAARLWPPKAIQCANFCIKHGAKSNPAHKTRAVTKSSAISYLHWCKALEQQYACTLTGTGFFYRANCHLSKITLKSIDEYVLSFLIISLRTIFLIIQKLTFLENAATHPDF